MRDCDERRVKEIIAALPLEKVPGQPEKADAPKDEKPKGDGKTKAQREAEFIAKNKAAQREPGQDG